MGRELETPELYESRMAQALADQAKTEAETANQNSQVGVNKARIPVLGAQAGNYNASAARNYATAGLQNQRTVSERVKPGSTSAQFGGYAPGDRMDAFQKFRESVVARHYDKRGRLISEPPSDDEILNEFQNIQMGVTGIAPPGGMLRPDLVEPSPFAIDPLAGANPRRAGGKLMVDKNNRKAIVYPDGSHEVVP